ncbi:polysaccharide deacetylase family protein [Staphylospora marina]|uniref:polysaccharide deacetylase family protein n=1 Tax=Staphylospora marina TaxID=2490858 RepID=UPI000F5B9FA4|nr:polysaccharide deacetylase family protein [Staphylospora marina]
MHLRRLTALIALLVCTWMVAESVAVTSYVNTVRKGEWVPAFFASDAEEELGRRIEKEAPKRYKPPVDARVDPIWKAIPGLNGLEVDVRATLEKTLKQKDHRKIAWVYRQVPPKVSLEDLGAEPIYRGNPEKRMTALMVNVAWGTEHIPDMLAILRRENVKATFFLDGSWLQKNPDMARRIHAEGHEIGNHAWSHPLMSRISRGQIEREIGRTNELIAETLKVKSRWFAPPAGDFNRQVAEVSRAHGMGMVLWTVDTVDWRKSVTPDRMIRTMREKLEPGSLVLTHPTDRTVLALPGILEEGRRKGLRWGTVSEVLSPKRPEAIE